MSRRLFISVDLDESLYEAIADVQAPFDRLPGVRAVDPESVHVTLKFLGDVEDERLEKVGESLADAVAAADVGRFTARFGGIGVFPDFDYISVIWVGVRSGGSELERLHEAIEAAFVDAGFEPEGHTFTPHVTICRMDHGGAKEQVQDLLRARDPDIGEMGVTDVRLTESMLSEDGPAYVTRKVVPL